MNYDIISDMKSHWGEFNEGEAEKLAHFLSRINVNPITAKYNEATQTFEAEGKSANKNSINMRFSYTNGNVNIFAVNGNTSLTSFNRSSKKSSGLFNDVNYIATLTEDGLYIKFDKLSTTPIFEFYDLSAVEYLKKKASDLRLKLNPLDAVEFRVFAKANFIEPDKKYYGLFSANATLDNSVGYNVRVSSFMKNMSIFFDKTLVQTYDKEQEPARKSRILA